MKAIHLVALALALLVPSAAMAAGAQRLSARDGDAIYVNRNIVCVVDEGGLLCAVRSGLRSRNYSVSLNAKSAAISRAGNLVYVCWHGSFRGTECTRP